MGSVLPAGQARLEKEAVVASIEECKKLSAREQDLVSFLRSSPLVGVHLQIERDDDPGRGAVSSP